MDRSDYLVFLVKVSALCSAGGEHNLILLDRSIHKPNPIGTVGRAGSTFGPLHKSRLGEQEFEALMRTLDNLVSVGATNGDQRWGFTEPDNLPTHQFARRDDGLNDCVRALLRFANGVLLM